MRLTRKSLNCYDGYYQECCDKLGQLEDIEEEFKVDLIQVANKKCEVWFKKEIIEYDNGGNWYKELDRHTIIHNSIVTAINFDTKTLYIKGAKMWVSVKDYGKTWALTKEELL